MKYTKELLEPIVKESYSIAEVIKKLNKRPSGGMTSHFKSLFIKFNIDTNHFKGQAHRKGKISSKRKTADQIFLSSTSRTNQLVRALIEKGIEYKCSECNVDSWNGKKITLQVDHKDGNHTNNLFYNLRFLCPNCHSQTETFAGRNIYIKNLQKDINANFRYKL